MNVVRKAVGYQGKPSGSNRKRPRVVQLRGPALRVVKMFGAAFREASQ